MLQPQSQSHHQRTLFHDSNVRSPKIVNSAKRVWGKHMRSSSCYALGRQSKLNVETWSCSLKVHSIDVRERERKIRAYRSVHNSHLFRVICTLLKRPYAYINVNSTQANIRLD